MLTLTACPRSPLFSSFDVLRDGLGEKRTAFPHEMLLIVGSQAAVAKSNSITLLRLRNLTQGRHGKRAMASDSDSELDASSDDDDDGSDADMQDAAPKRQPSEGGPVMHSRSVAHHGTINRVRSMPQQPGLVAIWAESGHVKVYDLSMQAAELAAEAQPRPPSKNRPLQLQPRHMHAHPAEGYALDWSGTTAGQLAAGDTKGRVHVWTPREGAGGWVVGGAFSGHTAAVEDLQWSPTEATVFASSSSDNTIRVWYVMAVLKKNRGWCVPVRKHGWHVHTHSVASVVCGNCLFFFCAALGNILHVCGGNILHVCGGNILLVCVGKISTAAAL